MTCKMQIIRNTFQRTLQINDQNVALCACKWKENQICIYKEKPSRKNVHEIERLKNTAKTTLYGCHVHHIKRKSKRIL